MRLSGAAGSAATPAGPRLPVRVALALFLVQVLFGVHYYAAKRVLEEIEPLPWSSLRVCFAAAILLPIAFVLARGPLPRRRHLPRLAGLSVLGVLVNQLFFAEGLSRTTVSHSALINSTIPVLTLLLALALRRERADARKLAAIGVAVSGVAVLLRLDAMAWTTMTRGDLLTLINACAFAAFLVLARPVMVELDPLVATAVILAFGGVGLLILAAPAVAALDPSSWSAATWLWGAYAVLGATVVAYALNSLALRRVESSMVAFFIFLQPLIGAVLDVWLLGAVFDLRLAVAAALVVCGVAISLRARAPRPR